MQIFDVVVVGAGAAGLFCASVAGQKGLKVLVVDHSDKVAEKIRISGGGRCNFTNLETSPNQFLSDNPRFCRSALSRYTPTDFIDLVKKYGIAFHEKHKGQLFCDRSAEDIIQMLLQECAAGEVTRWQPCSVQAIRYTDAAPDGFFYTVDTNQGAVRSKAVVIASGGLAIPKIGATDFGYRIARQFGLSVIPTRPALVPLTFDEATWAPFAPLSGLSLPVHISTGVKKNRTTFSEDLLLTHRGLSGPGVLQISSYWQEGSPIAVNLVPQVNLGEFLADAKMRSRKHIANEMAALVPSRLADAWIAQGPQFGHQWERSIAEASDKALAALAQGMSHWEITPTGTEGYKKAEVTAGGIDTKALSGQTMESSQRGLYFIGEVVDVTGWLGGYNFQWAWASGFACAQALAAQQAV